METAATRRQRLIDQIPTGGTGAGPTPQPDPTQSASGSELGRNVSNTLMALPGVGPGMGAASRLAGSALGKTATATTGAMALAKPALPYAPPLAGAAALGAVTANPAAPNPASGSPDEKAVGASQRMYGPVGNAGRGVMAPPGTVLDNGKTAPSDPRSRDFSAELNKVPANLPSDLREGVIHKTVDASGRVTYSGRNVAPGADGKTHMVDGLGKTLQSKGQVLTSNSAPVAGPNGGFAIDNNGPTAAERMAQTRATLTNPDGSAWSAADNATMAANIRDGVNPYRGTQRGIADDKAAQSGQLMNLALSPNGTPGKSNAVKLLAMQESAKAQSSQQQLERDRQAQAGEGVALESSAKRQMLDAQRAVTTAKTPEERKSAVELLAGLQGKTAQTPEEYAYAPGGQEVDPASGQLVTRPGVIFNKRTGQTVQPGQAQGQSINTDPRAIAIRDNPKLTPEQKRSELNKIGYQ